MGRGLFDPHTSMVKVKLGASYCIWRIYYWLELANKLLQFISRIYVELVAATVMYMENGNKNSKKAREERGFFNDTGEKAR